jgi:hypothetical protein
MISTPFSNADKELMTEIERIRNQLILLGNRHGFLHAEVQNCSRQLDRLLVQFYEAALYDSKE